MKKFILSLSTTAMLCSSIFADEWTDYRVKNFRRDHAAIIEAKKKELGTTWDAIAIINIAKDKINTSGYVEEVQEHLDLLKAVYKGVGFANGVVKATITPQERALMKNGLTAYGRKINKAWQGFVTQNYGADKGGACGDASILPAHLKAVDDVISKNISSSVTGEDLTFTFNDFESVIPHYYYDYYREKNYLLEHFGRRNDFHTLLETIKNSAADKYSEPTQQSDHIKNLFDHLNNKLEFFNLDDSDECFNEIKSYVMYGYFAESFYKKMKNKTIQKHIEKFRNENNNKDRKQLDYACLSIIELLNHVKDENYNEKYIDEALKIVKVADNPDGIATGIDKLRHRSALFSLPKKERLLILQLLNTPSAFNKVYTIDNLLYSLWIIQLLDEKYLQKKAHKIGLYKEKVALLYILLAIKKIDTNQVIRKAALESIELAARYQEPWIAEIWAKIIDQPLIKRKFINEALPKIIKLVETSQTIEEKFKLAEKLEFLKSNDDLINDFLTFADSSKNYNEFISNILNPYLVNHGRNEFKSLLP